MRVGLPRDRKRARASTHGAVRHPILLARRQCYGMKRIACSHGSVLGATRGEETVPRVAQKNSNATWDAVADAVIAIVGTGRERTRGGRTPWWSCRTGCGGRRPARARRCGAPQPWGRRSRGRWRRRCTPSCEWFNGASHAELEIHVLE